MESKSHISYRYRVSRSTTLHNCYLDRYYTNNLCNAIMNTGQMLWYPGSHRPQTYLQYIYALCMCRSWIGLRFQSIGSSIRNASYLDIQLELGHDLVMTGVDLCEHVRAGLVELGVEPRPVAVPVHLGAVYQRLLPPLADAASIT